MRTLARRRSRAAIAGAALFALLSLPTGADAAGWLPFMFASPAGREADQTKVGVDKDGNVTAIWRDDEDIKDTTKKVTIRSARLPFGAAAFESPLSVTTGETAGDPQIGVTENGGAVATWRRLTGGKYKVEGTTLSGGLWGSPTEISDPADEDVHALVMAMAKNGVGLIAWMTDTEPSYTNNIRLISGGSFAPAPNKKYLTSPYPGNNEPDVAVAPDGSARYLIGHSYNLGETELNLFKYTGAGPWPSSGELIDKPSSVPDVAVAPNGEPVSAWFKSGSGALSIKRGGNPIVPVATAKQLSLADLAVGPATEEFPSGMVLYAWLDFVDDGTHACCKQVLASVGDGVTMSAPIELSDELEEVVQGSVRVAVGPDGTGYVAWTRFDGSVFVPQASVRPPKESFPPVADDLSGGDAYVTDLVTAADGRAIVGIQKIDSIGEELYFRAGISTYEPPAPPPPDAGSKPGGPSAPSGPAPATDTKAPKVKLRLSRKGFAPGNKLNQIAVKSGDPSYVRKAARGPLKEGTRVLVALDEPASLALRVDKLGCFTSTPANPTRSVSNRCDKPDPNVQHFRATGKAGLNKLTYLGSWPGGRVRPGALYEFEVVATDRFGNSSRPQRIHFTLDGEQNADGF